ncbi:MAG: class I SAM-dependent methyltransferase [Clostridiales bacterium]|nr:class I SAM-dependent methyltransferase [Clostridiales bacterium]
MGIIDILVQQCRKPNGILGAIMMKSFDIINEGFFDWALNLVDIQDGNILDIGCGSGKTVYKLAKKYNNILVHGMDYSNDAVKSSIKRNKKFIEKEKVKIFCGSVEKIPFADNYFDYIFAIRTHYFWVDLQLACMEIFKKLKHGGKFIVISETYKIQYHMSYYNTEDSFKKLLLDVGFSKVELINKEKSICMIAQK